MPRTTTPDPVTTEVFGALVEITTHQFGIEDPNAEHGVQPLNANWFQIHLGVRAGRLTVYTNRASGLVPVTIERTTAQPTIDDEAWSHIVLAHFECRGGSAVVYELYAAPRAQPMFALSPGSYRVAICAGDVDSTDYDGSVGSDHYGFIFWPGEPIEPQVIKACGRIDRARTTIALPLPQCMTMLDGSSRHERFRAMPELVRHATPEALARLQAAARAGDALDRVTAIGALSVGRPIRIDQLEPFLADDDVRIRRAIMPVLHAAMLDFEFERSDGLDSDVAYRILNRLAADPERSIQDAAARLLTELDGLAELLA